MLLLELFIVLLLSTNIYGIKKTIDKKKNNGNDETNSKRTLNKILDNNGEILGRSSEAQSSGKKIKKETSKIRQLTKDDANTEAEMNSMDERIFDNAAVAADHHLCSKIGKEILLKGGSAVDSAIATHFCVEVVNSHSTGLGGGGFLIAYNPNAKDKYLTLDFRESLPKKFINRLNVTQGETILIPGVLKGLYEAHKRFGKLAWRDLLQPAIGLAKNGFRIHLAFAKALEKKKSYILSNLGLREAFAPEGYVLKEGNLLKRPNLAKTYELIAKNGSDVFYKGKIAKIIIDDIKKTGGIMELEDLADYEVLERPPIFKKIAGYTFYTVPPPANGVTVLLILSIMEKFNWTRNDLEERPVQLYHEIIEAMKFAFAPSTFIGDPNFINHIDDVVEFMLNDDNIEKMYEKIDDKSHIIDYYGPMNRNKIETSGTSHISVLGPDGDACSLTSSINAYFGAKIMSRKLGFIYNNELSDFSEFWPTVYNLNKDVKIPRKRPVSKVAPIIALSDDDQVKMVIGAAGGFFIPSALSMTIANYLFFGDNLRQAICRPRLHCQLFPPTVVVENNFPTSFIDPLINMNHKLVTNDTYTVSGQPHAIMGVVQAIVRKSDGKLAAECDYRKGGLPDGF